MNNDYIIDEEQWYKNAPIIKQFIDQLTNYEALCQEVAFVLKHVIEEKKIEYASITYRAKTLKSFLEKIHRKEYKNPFEETTDFAGVRLVFLYKSDYAKIEALIKNNFVNIKTEDKSNQLGTDKFGYNAKHYVVQLGKQHSGPRYQNLKNIDCEIQIRTVLQDAWAIIDHHLVYKNETIIPAKLTRQLNTIAGSLELSDDHLCNLRKDKNNLIKSIDNLKSDPINFLKSELNIYSFSKYLDWKFVKLYRELWTGQMEFVFNLVQKTTQLRTLEDLNIIVDKAEPIFKIASKGFLKLKFFNSSSVAVLFSVAIENEKLFIDNNIPEEWRNAIIESKK